MVLDFHIKSEEFAELGEGAGVHDILGAQPALPGNGHTDVEKMKMLRLVSIGIEAAKDAQIPGLVPPAPIEVEAPRVAVEFDPRAGLGGNLKHFGEIQRIGLTLKE